MKRFPFATIAVVLLLSGLVGAAEAEAADDAADDAAQKDKQLYVGTWKVLSIEVNGKDIRQEGSNWEITNDEFGNWKLRIDDKESGTGTHVIDPTKTPKTIDIMPSDGEQKDKVFLGIYEIGENERTLCLALPGAERPKEISGAKDNQVLIKFERVKAE